MEPARVRIQSHRLMKPAPAGSETRVSETHTIVNERARERKRVLRERSKLHVLLFFLSFVFATGIATLSILVFVRSSENLLRLVLSGITSAGAFVIVFACMRYVLLTHPRMKRAYSTEDEAEHHVAKSVAYGFVALVVALILAGLIITTASASSVF